MSETWADAQFDLLEDAYNEIPIEAKARIEQLESFVRDMARELRDLNDNGIPTDCMEHEGRMRELGIEVD